MFDKLIGNDHIKKILKRLLKQRRVPNAFLFAGVEGIGKRLFALEIAKAFVCQNPTDGEACDRCAACRRADQFSFPSSDDREAHKKVIFSEHPDIGTVIPFNRNILVDAVRDLEKEANFRPYEANARFFLINPADKMNVEASNALLKTLEEPPASSHIFLITSRPNTLLPTILSRCQTLRFAPIPSAEIEKHLLSTKEFAPDDARLLAKLSRGRLNYALNLDLEKLPTHRMSMLNVLESLIIKQDRAALLRTAEEMNDPKNKEEYENYLRILQTLIHDVWKIKLGAEGLDIVNYDFLNQLKDFAKHIESRDLSDWLSQIGTLRERFAVNINRKIATDALFIEMANY